MQHSDSDSATTNTSSRRKKSSPVSSQKAAEHGSERILWSEWWPFNRATGTALKQLNRPQRKDNYPHDVQEALL